MSGSCRSSLNLMERQSLKRSAPRSHAVRLLCSQAVPLALSDKFASDPMKISQWAGFLRKSDLKDQEMSLAEVVSLLERFLLPALKAAQFGDRLVRPWIPANLWITNSA